MIEQSTVREALIRCRRDNNLSLRDVERLTGVSQSTLSRLELGVGKLDTNNLYAVVRFVQLPIDGYVCDGDTLPNIKKAIYADDNLDEQSKETLFAVISIAYRQFVKI